MSVSVAESCEQTMWKREKLVECVIYRGRYSCSPYILTSFRVYGDCIRHKSRRHFLLPSKESIGKGGVHDTPFFLPVFKKYLPAMSC